MLSGLPETELGRVAVAALAVAGMPSVVKDLAAAVAALGQEVPKAEQV